METKLLSLVAAMIATALVVLGITVSQPAQAKVSMAPHVDCVVHTWTEWEDYPLDEKKEVRFPRDMDEAKNGGKSCSTFLEIRDKTENGDSSYNASLEEFETNSISTTSSLDESQKTIITAKIMDYFILAVALLFFLIYIRKKVSIFIGDYLTKRKSKNALLIELEANETRGDDKGVKISPSEEKKNQEPKVKERKVLAFIVDSIVICAIYVYKLVSAPIRYCSRFFHKLVRKLNPKRALISIAVATAERVVGVAKVLGFAVAGLALAVVLTAGIVLGVLAYLEATPNESNPYATVVEDLEDKSSFQNDSIAKDDDDEVNIASNSPDVAQAKISDNTTVEDIEDSSTTTIVVKSEPTVSTSIKSVSEIIAEAKSRVEELESFANAMKEEISKDGVGNDNSEEPSLEDTTKQVVGTTALNEDTTKQVVATPALNVDKIDCKYSHWTKPKYEKNSNSLVTKPVVYREAKNGGKSCHSPIRTALLDKIDCKYSHWTVPKYEKNSNSLVAEPVVYQEAKNGGKSCPSPIRTRL